MQTIDIIKPISQMTDEELMEKLRTVRHNREVSRPVARKKAEVAEKKTTRKKISAIDKVVDTMTDEEKRKLIELLGG